MVIEFVNKLLKYLSAEVDQLDFVI